MRFATVRLGKDSVDEIRGLVRTSPGPKEPAYVVHTRCKQFPTDVNDGDYAVIWLGSDNDKGQKTEWEQGFRAIGRFRQVEHVASRDQETHFDIEIGCLFSESIGRITVLKYAADGYYWCCQVPILGVDDRANQTVRVITEGELSNVSALLYCFGMCIPGLRDELEEAFPELGTMLSYVPPNPRQKGNDSGQPLAMSVAKPIADGVPRQRIFFGAPGTGKSYSLNQLAIQHFSSVDSAGLPHMTRVTFHPEYSFFQFVGTYRPETEDDGSISYKFVPGPLATLLVRALNDPEANYLLILEELNRANPAAVFGELFQLLDRDDDGVSEYPTEILPEFQRYLDSELSIEGKALLGRLVAKANSSIAGGHTIDSVTQIVLPGNLYIWATMNSADQGVFPLDTAFKRRWNFDYKGIDENSQLCLWDAQRRAINSLLREHGHVPEDKLIGPFFLKTQQAIQGSSGLTPEFKQSFRKVLMYLFEDAAQHCRAQVFDISLVGANPTLNEIFDAWDSNEFAVFNGVESLSHA